jgi:DNA-directed RNA polymerase specialized sigma24 family protein
VPDSFEDLLLEFIKKPKVKRLSDEYRVKAESALGYLWESMRLGIQNATNPKAWVYGNGIGHLKNYLRKECNQSFGCHSLARLQSSHALEPEIHPDRITVEDQEVLAIAQTELNRMPVRQRDAFLARAKVHPMKFSCRQVARRYGRSPAAVGKWVEKARQRLASVLEVRR